MQRPVLSKIWSRGQAFLCACLALLALSAATPAFGQSADLALTKTDSPDPVTPGSSLLYTLSISNGGPNTATGVVVTDTLPGGVTFQSSSASQGSCTGTVTVTCNLGSILNGGTATVQILVTAGGAGSVTNNASVTSAVSDPNAANNSASAGTTIAAGSTIDVPLTQYTRIQGFIDTTVTGGSLRTQPNGTNPCALGASSSASLSGITGGAAIRGAYLYWVGSGSTVDSNITLDGAALAADRTFTARYTTGGNNYDFFGGFKDVTTQVTVKGNGSYTFAGLSVASGPPYCASEAVLAGWALLVVYEHSSLSGKIVVLYDGFDIGVSNSTSYTLTGFYATAPTAAKTVFLSWEGDETLAGSERLLFNGASQTDAFNPATNIFNSTINTLGSSTAYGMDLDTFDVSSLVSAGDTLATTQIDTGTDLVILNAVLLQAKTNVISGTVFEDVNYGGGAGRNLATAAAAAPSFTVRRSNVTAELYDATGSLLRTRTSDSSGLYAFAGVPNGSYNVRIVNQTVSSSRSGATGSEWPVQTYRTNASSGTAVAVTGAIGGATPSGQDSPVNATNANLASLTAQSLAPVTIVGATSVANVDFGYNFDTIVNGNDSGQGSLRQFIVNADALANTNLAQAGLTAGVETSLFMIPTSADPFGRTVDPNYNAGRGVARISPASAMPAVTAASTAIDGTTQTTQIGNSNAGSLGTGGTVGVDGIALPQVASPEIELLGNRSFALFDFAAGATSGVVRGLAAYGFTQEILVHADGILIEHNVLGTPADSFADPGAGVRSSGNHIQAPSPPAAASGTIRENLVAYGGSTGNALYAAGWTIRNNEIRSNGKEAASDDGIAMHGGAGSATILENLIVNNAGFGIDLMANAGGNTITDNTITGNGGGNGTPTQRGGIRLMGSGSTIDRNVFSAQNGSGIHVSGTDAGNPAYTPAIRNTITHNSFNGNGLIGIDLLAAGADTQVGDGVTLNDGALNASSGNDGLDFPVITLAQLAGGTLHVQGTVSAGARVEIYRSDNDPSGYGEGLTYLNGLVEGSGSDADAAAGSFDFTFAVSGVAFGDKITSLALLEPDSGSFPGQYDTSEFSANATAVTDLEIVKRAYQLDGTPISTAPRSRRACPSTTCSTSTTAMPRAATSACATCSIPPSPTRPVPCAATTASRPALSPLAPRRKRPPSSAPSSRPPPAPTPIDGDA